MVNALTIPIAIRYLGVESLWIWTTISTLLTMLLVLDLGVANSLTNFISEAYARNDREHAGRYSTTALSVMMIIAGTLGLATWALWPHLHWYAIFHLSSPREILRIPCRRHSTLDLPGRPARPSRREDPRWLQELRTANIFAAVGSIGNRITIVLLIHLRAGLAAMVAGSAAALVGADILCLFWLMLFRKPWLRPRLTHLNRVAARRMLKMGTEFFVLQIAGLVVFNSDNLVVTHYLGPAQVAPYSVAWRLVGYAAIAQTLLTPALWPAFSEAFDRGDLPWVRQAFRRTMWITMGTALGFALFFAVFGRWIIRLWATDAAVPGETLMLLMCAWVLISTFMNNTSTVLVSKGKTQLQSWLAILAAALNLGLSIWLVQRIGSEGVILGTIVSYLFVLVGPQTYLAMVVLYRRKPEAMDATPIQ